VAALPAHFHFGVATAGFQIEGGYNGAGQPANNWRGWEAAGKVEPAGVALDFWNDWPHQLDLAAGLTCDAFRLSLEWARCEPADGEIDTDALDRYATILEGCRERGLEPLVTLHHFTHPHWLGEDFWLRPDSPERFADWVGVAVDHLGDRCHRWVTLNEINIYALQTWITGEFPPGRRADIAATVRTLDHMLTAHVLAYDAIVERQPDASVSTNPFTFSVYELERLLVDVLLGRSHGVGRHDLRTWLIARKRAFHRAVAPRSPRERALRRFCSSTIPLDHALPRAVGAVYASPNVRCLGSVQMDWYDPVVSHHIRLPGHRTAGGRNWQPGRRLWDDPPDPGALQRYCEAEVEPGLDLDLEIVENGLCNRVVDGVSYPRLDGWDRPRYLRSHLEAVSRAAAGGVPLRSYFHWTLGDNYEWGSYEPRFGIYATERHGDRVTWSDHDSMGDDAAGAYRDLIARLRAR
jgi:beta-glucosidase/6-phospho-beta-glucosidase/beta-galactosidase